MNKFIPAQLDKLSEQLNEVNSEKPYTFRMTLTTAYDLARQVGYMGSVSIGINDICGYRIEVTA